MAEQQASPEEIRALMRGMVPLWMRVLFTAVALLMAAFAAVSVVKNGLRNWDLLLTALSMVGFFVFAGDPAEPANTYLKRPMGILYVLWVVILTAWLIHGQGWIPAVCIGGAYVLGLFRVQPKREGEVWWRYYFHNPQAFTSTLLLFAFVVWLAWTTSGWVPIACVIATLFLAERNFKTRRPFEKNLMRPTVAVRIGLALIAALWAWVHPSFGNLAGPIVVLLLLSADIYLHTSSQEEPLALPHPQS